MPVLLSNGATIAEPGDQPGDLITRARQVEWNGLLTGAGTPFRWMQLTGWDTLPGIDLADQARPADHGDYAGRGFYQSRTITYQVRVDADPAYVEDLVTLLRARTGYGDVEQPLVVRDSAGTLWAGCRVIGRDITHEPQRTLGIVPAAIQFKATNPARFSPGTRELVLTPPASSGGLVFPVEYPPSYGEQATGSGTVVNDGDAAAAPVIVFTGPANGVSLTLADATGATARLAVGLPLGAGDQLEVDTGEGTVLLNGVSDRSAWLDPVSVPPELIRFPPGASTVGLQTVAGAGQGTGCRIWWANTWT